MWESFNVKDWNVLPHVVGRVATEDDVKNGKAVFYIPEGSIPCEAILPTCAIQINEESKERIPAVVIQAEQVGDMVHLGLRYLDGGNGICELSEAELLDEPNEEFNI